MQLKVKKIIIDSFKGMHHAEYDLSSKNIISGANGTGKTTIADAHFWLWANCDYALNSNPEIHPDFMEESEPSVAEIIEIDGVELEVKKIQQDSRTKRQKEEGAPRTIKNTYEINSVPKAQKDFVADMTERGVDFDKFLMLSHIDIFTSQKSAECRNILFGMVSDVTDKEIAESLDDCKEAAELLANYKPDEVMAKVKREKKEADAQIDAIPNQIIGLEKAKEDIDVSALDARRIALQAEINDLKAKTEKYSSTDEERLTAEITSAESELKAIGARANAERLDALNIANNAVSEVEVEVRNLESRLAQVESSIKGIMEHRDRMQVRYDELSAEFAEVKTQEFKESNCAYCGQPLPVEKTDELRKAFEQEQTNRKAKINAEGQRVRAEIQGDEDAAHKLCDEKKSILPQLETAKASLAEAKERRNLYTEPVDVTGTDEYKAAWDKLESLKADLRHAEENAKEAWEISEQLVSKGHEMKNLNDQIARAQVNDRIDAQITDLKAQQKAYAQAKANAEKVLYQLSLISMEKNRKLTEQVNSHFNLVKFRLFDQQKNGEYKDCCIPMIGWKVFNQSANTALMMRGQLDIIEGLSKFYGQEYPLFVDGAEQFDSVHANQVFGEIENQTILLCVNDDDLDVRAM